MRRPIGDISSVLVPATLICEMLGVPVEDQDKFTQWTTDATHGLAVVRGMGDDELRQRVEAAGTSLVTYFTGLIAERRGKQSDGVNWATYSFQR